jgi:membrane dipeptidase
MSVLTMNRRQFLVAGVAAGILGHGAARGGYRWPPSTIDLLGGISNPNLNDTDAADEGIDARAIADARASGLYAFNQTIGYVMGPDDPYDMTTKDLTHWRALIARQSALRLVERVRDLDIARKENQLGVILGFQNGAMLGSEPERVRYFFQNGVRVFQLTYNIRNGLGDGSMCAENRGLTPTGHEMVAAIEAARGLVDLSHSGEQTCLDAIAAAQRPLIISHTGCRAVTDLPRNKTDRELRGIADHGGMVGIYFMPFLAKDRQPTADDLVAHIEHAWQVCGEEHVGIGTDGVVPAIDDMTAYRESLRAEVAARRAAGVSATGERDDIVPFLPDLSGPSKFSELYRRLLQRGHSQRRLDALLQGNFLRVAQSVWPG